MSRRLKIGCGVFIVLMVAAVVIPLTLLRSRPVEVDVEVVERADVRETVSAVPVSGQPAGMVKPDEVKVIPKVGGELVSLVVREGDRVEQGQVIACLDPRPSDLEHAQARAAVDSARARVAQARANLAAAPTRAETTVAEAQAGRDKAVANYDAAVRGARVEEIERSRQAVVQAEKDLEDAEATLATVKRGARTEEIAAAEAALKQARMQADASKANLDLMLAGPRREEVAQAQAALTEAEADLVLRKTELGSQLGLSEKGFVSRNALKTAQTAYETAVARRDAARQRLAVAEQPHRPEQIEQARASYKATLAAVDRAESDLLLIKSRSTPEDIASATARRDAAGSRLQAARADLKLMQSRTSPEDLAAAAATVQQADAGLRRAEADRVSVREQALQVAQLEAELRRSEAALQQAADQAGYTIIAAPIDGVVTRINVEKGEYVQGGAIALPSADIAMLVITSDVVWIECNIDESDVASVAEGQEAEVFVTDAEPLKGIVHHVSPSVRLVEGDVRTFAVEIALDAGEETLRSGMSVDVDIIVKSTKNAVSVPAFAVFDDKEGKQYVYVVEDGKARKREITKGAEGIERTEVTEGVKEGESVITSLEVKGLRDGKKVKVRAEGAEDNTGQDENDGGDVEVELHGTAPSGAGRTVACVSRREVAV
ncbi:MAG TPA: hypothetical protein DGT21_05460 [Armatimonadetes bacterium]|jgi:HlyD family secretion protein|nr:hypothetical protein [Armatimonadota bacterium]